MKRYMRLWLLAWLGVLCLTASLPAAPAKTPETFRIGGAVARPAEWSASKIERDFAAEISTLSYAIKGEKYSSRCIPLLSLLQAAQPRFTGQTKHPELRFLVKVEGRDGFVVWFSMAELLPNFGKREVYLALDVNGQPFAGKEAPVRLLTLGEKDYGRWIYGIKTITIVDGAKIKTR